MKNNPNKDIIGETEDMVRNIANCKGNFKCQSWNELKDFITKSSFNSLDDIWINGNDDYPCLAILINREHACVHYFLDGDGNMWQSVGYGKEDVAFVCNGEKSVMPANSVISLDKALECAKQFFQTLERPSCIEWRDL